MSSSPDEASFEVEIHTSISGFSSGSAGAGGGPSVNGERDAFAGSKGTQTMESSAPGHDQGSGVG